ncbi:MAG: hypothetical protein LC808_30685 [Actinobacteria bacterium]|nr:hypothetical protein [Actinomycetota bacterium]
MANSIQTREVSQQTKILSRTNKALLAQAIHAALHEMSGILLERPHLRKWLFRI